MDVKVLRKVINKSRTDPNWFCENILKSPNDPWQEKGMDAVADLFRLKEGIPTKYNHDGLKRFTVVAFHGCGKTHFMAKLMHWFNFVVEGRIPCTAPKEKQLTTRLWPEFRKVRRNAISEYKNIMLVETKAIYWGNDPDHVALVESASVPDNLAGHHFKFMMFLVEEASGVNEEMFPVIEGALTESEKEGGLNILVLIGNPTKTMGEFYDSHNKRKTMEMYYQIKIKHEDTRRIDPEWVENMITKYGINSPVVQVRVFGNFVEASENQLVVLQWLEEARREWKPDGSIRRLILSCDVADGGEDETVITVAYEYDSFTVLKSMHRFSFPPAESPILAAEAMIRIAEAENYDVSNGDMLIVDSIGVGAGTAGVLIKDKRFSVMPFKGGSTDNIDTKQWRNQRVRSFIVMRDGFRDKKIIIDEDFCDEKDWEDYIAQMCSIRTKPGIERVEDLVSKQEMKSNGVKSPDMPDSSSMIFANQTPQLGFSDSEFVFAEGQFSDNQVGLI